jgi:hypothetical protein
MSGNGLAERGIRCGSAEEPGGMTGSSALERVCYRTLIPVRRLSAETVIPQPQ